MTRLLRLKSTKGVSSFPDEVWAKVLASSSENYGSPNVATISHRKITDDLIQIVDSKNGSAHWSSGVWLVKKSGEMYVAPQLLSAILIVAGTLLVIFFFALSAMYRKLDNAVFVLPVLIIVLMSAISVYFTPSPRRSQVVHYLNSIRSFNS